MSQDLKTLPLVFSFAQPVLGNGFVAGVSVEGRALLEVEEENGVDEFWISGITPVGITGGGADRGVAFNEFRKMWLEAVFDIAVESLSFDDFKKKCEEFHQSELSHMTSLWMDAVASVRRSHYTDPTLRKEDADKQCKCEVVDLTRVASGGEKNQVEVGPGVAA